MGGTRDSKSVPFQGDLLDSTTRLVLDSVSEQVIHQDLEMRVLWANRTAWRSVGESLESMKGRRCYELWQNSDKPCQGCSVVKARASGNPEIFETVSPDGRAWIVRGFPIKDATGRVTSVIEIVLEITDKVGAEKERSRLEAQLRHAQKLEAMGTLAGGVAHEINSPLCIIMNFAKMTLDSLDEAHPAREYVAEILGESQRISGIARSLLSFARRDNETIGQARMSDIVEATLLTVGTVLSRSQITLEVDVPQDLPPVLCRGHHVRQVLMNLLTNARDALDEKWPGYDRDKRISVSSQVVERGGRRFLRTVVEDSGTGIHPSALPYVFDPFFTTKPRERGTGLGLSVSQGLIRDLGGTITVESEMGRFTRFAFDLAVMDKEQAAPAGAGD